MDYKVLVDVGYSIEHLQYDTLDLTLPEYAVLYWGGGVLNFNLFTHIHPVNEGS